MLKLYSLRNKIEKQEDSNLDWKLKSINRVLKKEKEKITKLLDKKIGTDFVRNLKPEALKDKNVISLFSSSTTRALNLKINELTDELIVVNVYFQQVFDNLVNNGFINNGVKYIFLSASAGQIRTKKAMFIKQESFEKIKGTITCGLFLDEINEKGGCNPNKYMAYLSLANSATDVWEDFDIDKAIVVNDFETNVSGLVDFIDDKDYSIVRKQMDVPIPHMDGAGIMLNCSTRMVRLPWVKGLMIQFPFDKFIQEKCRNGKAIIEDIYGQKHDILDEGIEYIFTASQFKMHKYYSSWEDYKIRFKENHCQACYCKPEEDYIPKATINYQMLQTLTDMTDEEIQKIIKTSVEDISKIGNDYQTTMRLLGATEFNQNPNYMQQALMLYPEIMRDSYNRELLKDVKRSLVRKAKAGKVRVNGGYRFLSPDLYAFCEWLFLGIENPNGLLQDGEVYCKGYRDNDELACLRSPHLYREWAIRNNVRNEEIDKWFGMTQCVYTSTHDLITKILQFDVDGDISLVIKDRTLTNIAKRNMKNIVPLYYDMKKAKPVELNNQSIYEGMIKAYTSGDIGAYSNAITKIWNCGNVDEKALYVIKMLCMENNFNIDSAKTLYMPKRPKKIDKIIKSYTKKKVPSFFVFAKGKKNKEVEKPTQSTMCRIESSIPKNMQIAYSKTLSKFDYKNLLSDTSFEITPESYQCLVAYDYWNARQNMFYNFGKIDNRENIKIYAYERIKEKIIEMSGQSSEFVLNSLVFCLYTMRKQSNKTLLWECFGKELVENLKANISNLGNVCPICGKRFNPRGNSNTMYCSDECYRISNIQNVYKQRGKL